MNSLRVMLNSPGSADEGARSHSDHAARAATQGSQRSAEPVAQIGRRKPGPSDAASRAAGLHVCYGVIAMNPG
jgi:hypothetical protein